MIEYTDQELQDLHKQARRDADVWRKDYPEFERLADNGIIDGLDEALPEVNDGSLAAALFKLPKRLISSKTLSGRATAQDRDEPWVSEIANIEWEKKIIPNANSQSTFHRKWKDAVRKSAQYGSVPIITLFVKRGKYRGADFIVAHPQDVLLEPNKVSDLDSDVVFWEVLYSKPQVKQMLEDAKGENSSEWDKKCLAEIVDSYSETDELNDTSTSRLNSENEVKQQGMKFCVSFVRGIGSEFTMRHVKSGKTVRRWKNPDPTGDIPVHYLYCYQDFKNPYGIGIVKLAGGTQNVLDYMRQADVFATQLGFRPPVSVSGDLDNTDLDSIVYEQDAQWIIGNANIRREEISNQIYSQLPTRISMYKTSLNQLLPIGDTSIGSDAGDPQYSKTHAGVKFQESSLSIDDEDYKDNIYQTYELVAKSMLNTHFANMEGSDLLKLSDDEREILAKAGVEFPISADGIPTNELEESWDNLRATFDFKIEPEATKESDNAKRLEALLKVVELKSADPMLEQTLMASNKRLNTGELMAEIIALTTDNDKILEDIAPDEATEMGMDPEIDPRNTPDVNETEVTQATGDPAEDTQAVMQQYGVDELTAEAMIEGIKQGFPLPEVIEGAKRSMERNG